MMPSCKGSVADSDSDWEAPTRMPDAEPISTIPSESASLGSLQDAVTTESTNEAGIETCSEVDIAPSLEIVKPEAAPSPIATPPNSKVSDNPALCINDVVQA